MNINPGSQLVITVYSKMNPSTLIPVLLIILLCTAGCLGLTEKRFSIPEGLSDPPLSALWDGAVEVTGIEDETGRMSNFDLIMGGDGHVIRLGFSFSGEVDEERRYFSADLDLQGVVTVRPVSERPFSGSHPGQVFRDLEAIDPGALFGENDWTIHLKQDQGVTYDHANFPIYLMENRTLIPLDRVSIAYADAPVFYLSICQVAVPDVVVKTEHSSGAGIRSGGGRCLILFTPEDLEKTSYRRALGESPGWEGRCPWPCETSDFTGPRALRGGGSYGTPGHSESFNLERNSTGPQNPGVNT